MASRLVFRGLSALVLHRDDHDRRMLMRQLGHLGLMARCLDQPPEVRTAESCDVVFFDGDGEFDSALPAADTPLIALVGSETPSRLEWMLGKDPAALLVKPIRSSGVYSALVFAFANLERQRTLHQLVARLEAKVKGRPAVVSALLLIMRERQVDEAEAFRILRALAMARRQTVEALSAEIAGSSGLRPIAPVARHRRG